MQQFLERMCTPFLQRLKKNAYENLSVDDYTPDTRGWVNNGFDTCLEIIYEKNKNNYGLVVFEVGSWKGASAIRIADKFQGHLDSIVCIDTWLGAPEFYTQFLGDETRSVNQLNGWPQVFYIFTKNMKKLGYSDYVAPFPISSVQGAEVMKYHKIKADFIYLDAAHEYDAVLADMEAYRELLKPGGVLWGDDYHDTDACAFPGVAKAVKFFVKKYGLTLEVHGYNWIVSGFA